MKLYPCLAVAAVLLSNSAVANAQTLPAYMAPIAGKTAATAADIATKDVLALNTGMFELYGDAAKIFQKNILGKQGEAEQIRVGEERRRCHLRQNIHGRAQVRFGHQGQLE